MPNSSAVTPGEDRIRLLFRMRARRLLWRMMGKQGIDPAGRWWHGAEWMMARVAANCAVCAETDRCRTWLDSPEAPCGTPAFCPNGRALEAARIMDPHAPGLPEAPARNSDREANLGELMSDALVRQLMKADCVNGEILRHAMTDAPHFTAAFAAPQRRLRLGQR